MSVSAAGGFGLPNVQQDVGVARELQPNLGVEAVLNPLDNVKMPWHEKAISYLNTLDTKLEEVLPNLPFQDQADQIGRQIEAIFAPLEGFNVMLDKSIGKEWYHQLATFLAIIPVRAARNIIRTLYNLIKAILNTAIHPLKSLNNLAKLFIQLLNQLTHPDAWQKIGAGIVGSQVGQGLMTGNVFSTIGLGIGLSMLAVGLSFNAVKSAIKAEAGKRMDAAKESVYDYKQEVFEAALTGLYTGMALGYVQNSIMSAYRVNTYAEAKEHADQFVTDHNLPQYTSVELDPSGTINIRWDGQQFLDLQKVIPKELSKQFATYDYKTFTQNVPTSLKIELNAYNPQVEANILSTGMGHYKDTTTFIQRSSLSALGLTDNYPTSTVGVALGNYGSVVIASDIFHDAIVKGRK